MPKNFFDERREQSEIKAKIVTKYFLTWAQILLPNVKKRNSFINYLDFFCGPGRYIDGSKSTPLMILEEILKHPELPKYTQLIFNDADKNHIESLERHVYDTPNIKNMKFKPIIINNQLEPNDADVFSSIKMAPTFTFMDPFGYKGLSTGLINSVIKDFGSECLFFFNYSRINAGVSNELVESHMESFFSQDGLENLRKRLKLVKTPADRERAIMATLGESLSAMGQRYILPFSFRRGEKTRTTHHLIFVSKSFKGMSTMRHIMLSECNELLSLDDCLTFNERNNGTLIPLFSQDLKELRESILAYITESDGPITMDELYQTHSIGKPFVEKHYRAALIKLEEEGKIIASDPQKKKRRKGTFPLRLQISTAN